MGITLFENIEIGEIPETPSFNIFDARVFVPRAHQSILTHSSKYGFTIGYSQEQDGLLVQNLLPVRSSETLQISSSSKSNLELHTETAFHPFKPDYLVLLCLRSDQEAATNYSLAEEFVPLLSSETIKLLQQPIFITRVDDSFRTDGEDTIDIRLSVLRRKWDNTWSITYDKYAMTGITQEAQNALDELTNAIESCIRSIVLESGQMLVIDNSNVVHGRSSFKPKYDGTDRWLLRTLIVRSLPPLSHINGRVINTPFRRKTEPARQDLNLRPTA